MFGVANQLLSAIALAIGTTFIMKRTKAVYALVTFVPFVFIFVTTVTAAIMNIYGNYLPRHDLQGYLNVALTLVMLALAIIIACTCTASWAALLRGKRLHPGKPAPVRPVPPEIAGEF